MRNAITGLLLGAWIAVCAMLNEYRGAVIAGLIAVLLMLFVICTTGCSMARLAREIIVTDDPYEGGQLAAMEYQYAVEEGNTDVVQAAEISYQVLKEAVEGPTSERDSLTAIIQAAAAAEGVHPRVTRMSLYLGRLARRIIRKAVAQNPKIASYHEALSEYKRGIDEALEEYDR